MVLDNLLAHEVTEVCQAIADYHAYLAPHSPACISTKLLGYCLFMDGATAHPLRSGQYARGSITRLRLNGSSVVSLPGSAVRSLPMLSLP